MRLAQIRLGCALLAVVSAQNNNAAIITDMFFGETSEVIFDKNANNGLVAVVCNPTHMCVSIDEQYFIASRGHALDMNSITMEEPCEGNRTQEGTMLTMCTGNFGSADCGLQFLEPNTTHISYVTTLLTGNSTKVFDNGNQTVYKYNIPFQCTFPLEELLTLQAETGDKYGYYIPRIYPVKFITVLIKEGEGVGKFPVSMFLFKDSTWSEMHAEPPVKNVSDTLYIRIVLTKSPENAVIQARRCWATPFADPEGDVQFTLIEDFCSYPVANAAQDPEVGILKNGISNYAEWTSKVFQFSGPEYEDKVYLHCMARVCFNTDPNVPCNKVDTCGSRKKRAVGALGEVGDSNRARSDEVRLSLGVPIVITGKAMEVAFNQMNSLKYQDDVKADEFDTSILLNPLVGGVMISAIIVVIFVLIALVVVMAKRHSDSK